MQRADGTLKALKSSITLTNAIKVKEYIAINKTQFMQTSEMEHHQKPPVQSHEQELELKIWGKRKLSSISPLV